MTDLKLLGVNLPSHPDRKQVNPATDRVLIDTIAPAGGASGPLVVSPLVVVPDAETVLEVHNGSNVVFAVNGDGTVVSSQTSSSDTVVTFSDFIEAITGEGWSWNPTEGNDGGDLLVAASLTNEGFDSNGVALLSVQTGGPKQGLFMYRPAHAIVCDSTTSPVVEYRIWRPHTSSDDVLVPATECTFYFGIGAGPFLNDEPDKAVGFAIGPDGSTVVLTTNGGGFQNAVVDLCTVPPGQSLNVRFTIGLGSTLVQVSVDNGVTYTAICTTTAPLDQGTYIPIAGMFTQDSIGTGARFAGIDWLRTVSKRSGDGSSPFDGNNSFKLPSQSKLNSQLLDLVTDPLAVAEEKQDFLGPAVTTSGGEFTAESALMCSQQLSGTGAVATWAASLQSEAGHPGVMNLQTGTDTGGYAGIWALFGMNLNTRGRPRPGAGVITLTYIFSLSTLSTVSEEYKAVIGASSNVTSPAGLYVLYDRTISVNWIKRSSPGEVSVASTIPVTTGWHTLKIVVAADAMSSEFFMDGVSMGVLNDALLSALPIPSAQFSIRKTAGTTFRDMSVDFCGYREVFTTPRGT